MKGFVWRGAWGLMAVLVLAVTMIANAAAAEKNIRVWTFLDPTKNEGREIVLRKLIAQFEAQNPGVKITVEPQVWSQVTQKFVLASNAGNAPDVVWAIGSDFGLVIDSGAAADLNKLIFDHWTPQQKKDMAFKSAYDYATVDGKLLGVPLFPYAAVILYRKDMFKAAGLTEDSIKTWKGFAEAARKLTKDTNGDGTLDVWGATIPLAVERATTTPAPTAFMDLRGNLFDKKCHADFANPDGVRSLQMEVDLVTKDKAVSREDLSRTTDDSNDVFIAGHAAMLTIASVRYPTTQQKATWDKSQLGVAAWPSWDGKKPGPALMSAWFLTIWKKSPHPHEAAKFVEFLISPEASKMWTLQGGQLPIRRSVAELPELNQPQYAYLKKLTYILSDTGVFPPPDCNATRTLSDWNLAAQRVILGGKTPMEALKEAEGATNNRQ